MSARGVAALRTLAGTDPIAVAVGPGETRPGVFGRVVFEPDPALVTFLFETLDDEVEVDLANPWLVACRRIAELHIADHWPKPVKHVGERAGLFHAQVVGIVDEL